MRYTKRPPSNRPGARVAWDILAEEAAAKKPPRTIQYIWYAREMDDGVWIAYLNEIDINERSPYIEVDALIVRDRVNNPHKYAVNDASGGK